MRGIFLSIGSNLGEREHSLREAQVLLGKAGVSVRRESAMYECEPWGDRDQPWFLNQCVEVETTLEPEELLALIKKVEKEIGRVDGEKWGPRAIDIDILLYGSQTVDTEELSIPHREMTKRKFVLVPLSELLPVDSFLDDCQDRSVVRKIG